MSIPTTRNLESRLSGLMRRPIEVIDRTPLGTGTFHKEVVRLRDAPGGPCSLFVKFEGGMEHDDDGHRGGVGYEARVYEEVLAPAGFSAGMFIGAIRSNEDRDAWLVLQFLERSERVKKVPGGVAMYAAAEWSGAVHRAFGSPAVATLPSWLIRYDAAYLRQWLAKAQAAAGPDGAPISAIAAAYVSRGIPVLESAQTLVHGEYYPKNVLWADGRVVPVDWESAAVGAGEVDLAMLIDGWPDAITNVCITKYLNARWPGGAPADFEERFFWARVYTQLRWLADIPLEEAPESTPFERLLELQSSLPPARS